MLHTVVLWPVDVFQTTVKDLENHGERILWIDNVVIGMNQVIARVRVGKWCSRLVSWVSARHDQIFTVNLL